MMRPVGNEMKKISSDDLVSLHTYHTQGILRIDLAYTKENNTLFGEQIYRSDAKLYAHKDLAAIVVLAAKNLQKHHDLRLIVYDSLRTIEAQKRMLKTSRVQENPHWLEEPRLLSPPGSGAHPRGMAVDVALENRHGELLDMGTVFDLLAEDASPQKNPAHREHPYLTEKVRANRKILDDAMMEAAQNLNTPLIPLLEEWWDFRLPREIYEGYAPLSDSDLPEKMRCL